MHCFQTVSRSETQSMELRKSVTVNKRLLQQDGLNLSEAAAASPRNNEEGCCWLAVAAEVEGGDTNNRVGGQKVLSRKTTRRFQSENQQNH